MEEPSDANLAQASSVLLATRPTAENLRWALEQVSAAVIPLPPAERAAAARQKALSLRDEDIASCERIGNNGLSLLQAMGKQRVNVMTHCNAGWLAAVQWGTALAPIYKGGQSAFN